MAETIDSFTGHYAYLSNFFIESDGSCVEVEFQAMKTTNLVQRQEILRCVGEPKRAKRLGRKCDIRPGWDNLRVYVMASLVAKKFSRHPQLTELLMDTAGATLIEGNYWHDNFWGACTCDGCSDKLQQNQLGTILMSVRATLLELTSSK